MRALLLSVLLVVYAAPGVAQRSQPTEAEREARRQAAEERLRNDWAWLERYRQANAKWTRPAPGPTAVFMGDSITEGWARRVPEFFESNRYAGRGISGQTTPQMLLRFQQDVIALRPAVVVINAGTNDIAGNTGPSTLEMITNNLKSMAQLAEAADIAVVFASVTPAYDYPWRPGLEPAPKVTAVNQWMKGYCEGRGCVYADYHSSMSDEKGEMLEGLSTDGIHPNEKGYAVMAPIARGAIQEALSH